MPSTKARILGEAVSATGPINSTRAVAIVEATSSEGVLSRDGGIINYATVNDLPASGLRVGQQAFVTATSRIYMYNGAGWFSTALINATPAWDAGGQPSASYVLDPDSPQDAITVTLAASDPEGFNVSYNYIIGGSMDSIATIAQDSSVFTITPKTLAQLGDGVHTGSITFRATDGVNILPYVSSFTLTFVSSIVNSKYVRSLVRTTSASDNNNITDSSSSSHTITASGNPTAGTFSPYRNGGYSMEVNDNKNDYFIVPDDGSFNFGYGSFTYETWVYFTSAAGGEMFIGAYGGSSQTGTTVFSFKSVTNVTATGFDGVLALSVYYQGWKADTTATTFNFNEWIHVAVVHKVEGAERYAHFYKNGVQVGSRVVDNTNYTNNGKSVSFGRIRNGFVYNGRVSNIARTIAGNVPTEDYVWDSNTVALQLNKPYFAYQSSSSISFPTVAGSPTIAARSPFDYKEYSVSAGGSIELDTDDYLLIYDHPDFDLSSTFTIEGWFYLDAMPSGGADATTAAYLLNRWQANNNNRSFLLGVASDGSLFLRISSDGSTSNLTSSATSLITANSWFHVSLVLQSNVYKVYLNGTERISYSSSSVPANVTAPFMIGYIISGSNSVLDDFSGKISDVRIVDGTAIVPPSGGPTSPLTAVTNTKLLLKGTDASVIDLSQSSNLQLNNNAVGSTTQVKFAGSKSIDLTQNDAHISFPDPGGYGLGTAFTMEAWIYLTQWNGYESMFHETATSAYFSIVLSGTGFEIYNPGVSQPIFNSCGFVLNTWFHWAVCRDSAGAWYLFRDGNRITTGNSAINQNDLTRFADAGSEFKIGSKNNNSTQDLSGYIQEFRITDGLARYTSNFTPPVAEFEG